MTIDLKKQESDACCTRCSRGCVRKGGYVVRDWITILLFIIMVLSLVMLLTALGLKPKKVLV